jgi:uncharacterized protein (DUF433 family)
MEDDLIHRDPEIMLGKPVVRGTRITVEHILRQAAFGATREEIMRDYHLTADQYAAAFEYAAATLSAYRMQEAV